MTSGAVRFWNRRKSGDIYPELLAISVVRDPRGEPTHYLGVFTDISRLKAHEAELERVAQYDPLTGVPNRRLLADRLHQAIAQVRRSGRQLAICYLDLDGFKPVNDRLGHAAGDQLLIEVARRLQGVMRESDSLARLGGDEFVLLFTELAEPQDAPLVCERILRAVNAPVRIADTTVRVSASIGVTLYPQDDGDGDALLRHADQAMYSAKEAGKGRYHLYDPAQGREVQAQRDRLEQLGRALDDHEFVLHYQPRINLVTGRVVGAEALIRWQHPELGLLLPGEFLRRLAGTDLDRALGDWVVATALQQLADWNAAGLGISVSVNISADHLLSGDFPECLRRALAAHPNMLPEDLELEILETAALGDTDEVEQVFANCRQLGVRLALDDFGTGHSSLSSFRRLAVDCVKIDQSFIQDMLDDPGDLGIVESVIRLAKAFDRAVVAEGVETREQGALLVELGCRFAQGYGIARPMPAAELSPWIADWSTANWL